MKTLALLDITCPDYFTGYHKAVLQVPVSNRVTCLDIANGLEEEVNCIYDLLKESYSKTEILIIDSFIDAMRDKGNELYYDNTDTCDEIEDQYFYFGIIKPVYSNGMMFLNA